MDKQDWWRQTPREWLWQRNGFRHHRAPERQSLLLKPKHHLPDFVIHLTDKWWYVEWEIVEPSVHLNYSIICLRVASNTHNEAIHIPIQSRLKFPQRRWAEWRIHDTPQKAVAHRITVISPTLYINGYVSVATDGLNPVCVKTFVYKSVLSVFVCCP